MIHMIDTLMVLLFPFLDFIPFGLVRYRMFGDKLRIPFRYIVMLMFTVSAVNSAVFYYINLSGYESAAQWTTLMRYSFMLVNLIFAFALIKDSFPRLMFTYLLFLAWSFFVYGNANFIESRFFWDFSEHHPYLVYNIARVLIYLITCPLMFHFFNYTVTDALNIHDEKMWRYLWKIPLFSTLFGMLYCVTDDVYAYATWQFLASRYFMLLGACYVSYVALRVLQVSRNQMHLEEALKFSDMSLMAQKKQYDRLSTHMEDMRKARHDLRQHLTVVQSYLKRDDKTGLAEYIDIYKSELPADTLDLYSRNDVLNAVICYYAALARRDKIQFDAQVNYPDNSPVTDTEITVLVGNLLENALEASQKVDKEFKFIKLRIKYQESTSLLILVDNSYEGYVKFKNGTPLSSKREGFGIGAASIREIASRYNGRVLFEQRDQVYYASVYLKIT